MENSPARNRVSIFVDGANLFRSVNESGVRLDYLLLGDGSVPETPCLPKPRALGRKDIPATDQ